MDNLTAHNASEYDRNVRKTIPFYDLIHRETIDLVRAVQPEPRRWVDTGCGTGRFAEEALKAFSQTLFTLADPSEAMLVQARARIAATVLDRVTILPPADSAQLTSHVQLATVDAVTAIQCHHYLDNEGRRRAVQACFALLRPGGLFVTFENTAPATKLGTEIGLRRWKSYQLAQGKPEPEAAKHLARFGTEFFPITVTEHLQLLKDTGFRCVELLWFSQIQAGFYGVK